MDKVAKCNQVGKFNPRHIAFPEKEVTEIDLDQESWKMIKQAAMDSNWIPKEYYMNDWVADVCQYLREGK